MIFCDRRDPSAHRSSRRDTRAFAGHNARAVVPGCWAGGRVRRGPARGRLQPPRASSRRGRVIGPGRSILGRSPVKSRTVDSRPIDVGPLSMTRSISPSRSASTWSARVGEIRFDRFALGAAMGWSDSLDQAAGHRADRCPQGDGVRPGGDHVGDDGATIEHQRERARPEASGQPLGVLGPILHAVAGLGNAGNMDDQRIDRGPPLDRKDPRHGFGSGGDGPQAVDRFGREGDQPATMQHASSKIERSGVRPGGVDHEHARCRLERDIGMGPRSTSRFKNGDRARPAACPRGAAVLRIPAGSSRKAREVLHTTAGAGGGRLERGRRRSKAAARWSSRCST